MKMLGGLAVTVTATLWLQLRLCDNAGKFLQHSAGCPCRTECKPVAEPFQSEVQADVGEGKRLSIFYS